MSLTEQGLVEIDGKLAELGLTVAEGRGALAETYQRLESAGGPHPDTMNYIQVWERLGGPLLPVHRREHVEPGQLQPRAGPFAAAWQAAGTQSQQLYPHYPLRHAAADAEMLWSKYRMTLGEFSAQRSEVRIVLFW